MTQHIDVKSTKLELTEHFDGIGKETGIDRKPDEENVAYGERMHAALDEMIGELLDYQDQLRDLLAECDECESAP